MLNFISWACRTALALPLVIFVAAPAAVAHFSQMDRTASAIKREELEKALIEITEMLT